MLIQIFCLFLYWIILLFLCYKSSLYILNTRSLLDIRFTNMFLYSVGYVFILSIVCCEANTQYFVKQSILFWWSAIYLLSSFVACTFCIIAKKSPPNLRPIFTLTFSSKSFMAYISYFDPFWVNFCVWC